MLPQYFNPNIMPPMLSTADVTTQGCRLLSDDSAFSQRKVQEKMKTKEESRKLHQKKTLGRVEEEKAGEEEREKKKDNHTSLESRPCFAQLDTCCSLCTTSPTESRPQTMETWRHHMAELSREAGRNYRGGGFMCGCCCCC